jgi:ribosomal protein L34
MLPVGVCGCEKWSVKFREAHRLKVFENRVLRKRCGPKRKEIAAEWRKLHNEKFHDLCSLPYIIRVIKSRRIRWAGYVARMATGEGTYVFVAKSGGRDPLEDQHVDGRIILEGIFNKQFGELVS